MLVTISGNKGTPSPSDDKVTLLEIIGNPVKNLSNPVARYKKPFYKVWVTLLEDILKLL